MTMSRESHKCERVTLTLDAAPTPIITNGAATITATVRDEGGNPVMGSLPVSFTATLGTLDCRSAVTASR